MTTTLPVLGASAPASACRGCTPERAAQLTELGVSTEGWDHLVALAGNPNTGKSTVFNALTGLRQHTGNWPGKTVTRAEGSFTIDGQRVKLVDLPGTYSLQAGSVDEEVARDFILFAEPDVTVVVLDATRLERNLNLALQVLEITDRVVVVLNLIDEARRHGITHDVPALARELGVPVVATTARRRQGFDALLKAIHGVATGAIVTTPRRVTEHDAAVEVALADLLPRMEAVTPGLPNARWVGLRLLNGDRRIEAAFRRGELGHPGVPTATGAPAPEVAADVLAHAAALRWQLPPDVHDRLAERLFASAGAITAAVERRGPPRRGAGWDRLLDRALTSRWLGFPLMGLMLALVFWLTIAGANVPSGLLATLLVDTLHPVLKGVALGVLPAWLAGLLVDGVYLATAWVVSVMLPPMAIFFPLFTLLEDFGYLPRVAFNLDALFRRVGAHGKQALTMCMGFGCNAAGVVATRVIDSPRERLVAIITNNFSLCNGRWPTQILMASLFLGTLAPPELASVVAAGAVVGVALLGIAVMLATSWVLTRTVLRGEATSFSLELPPYRPPRILQTLYTSLVDRTLIVLWRAVVFAAPAGMVIWLVSNIHVSGVSVAEHLVGWLDPVGLFLGLNGVVLLAYVVAVPANELVIPSILMLTALVAGATGVGPGAGVLFELDNPADVGALLTASGWTVLTGLNLMLFSLLHNPCSTTIYTIYRETGSARWTALATLLPLLLGVGVTFVVTQVWRILG